MFIDGIKPGPAGEEIVQVIFSLDRNGLLEVTATYNEKTTRLQIDYNAESGTESYEPEIDEGSANDDDTMEFEMRSARVQLSATLERIHYDLEHVNLFILYLCIYNDQFSLNSPMIRKTFY